MSERRLREPEVFAIGKGIVGFSRGYGATSPEGEAIELIRYAYELGRVLIDTAEGESGNERLLARLVALVRQVVTAATRFRLVEAESRTGRSSSPRCDDNCRASRCVS